MGGLTNACFPTSHCSAHAYWVEVAINHSLRTDGKDLWEKQSVLFIKEEDLGSKTPGFQASKQTAILVWCLENHGVSSGSENVQKKNLWSAVPCVKLLIVQTMELRG